MIVGFGPRGWIAMMDVLAMRGCSHACPPVNIQSVGRGEMGRGQKKRVKNVNWPKPVIF